MISILFPRFCFNCKEVPAENFICGECFSEIEFISDDSVCFGCGEPWGFPQTPDNSTEHLCQRCIEGRYAFTKCRSIAYYTGLLRKLLHNYKYDRQRSLSGFLKWVAGEYFPYDPESIDVVIPVPVYIDKLRSREFNQSAVIGSAIANLFGIDHDPFILKKIKDTKAQAEIKNEKDRVKNIKNVFEVKNRRLIKDKNVLLVDDVFTTGSTTNECSRTLLNAGACSVYVLTLMRASL